jgi:hypothetical protein
LGGDSARGLEYLGHQFEVAELFDFGGIVTSITLLTGEDLFAFDHSVVVDVLVEAVFAIFALVLRVSEFSSTTPSATGYLGLWKNDGAIDIIATNLWLSPEESLLTLIFLTL